MKHRTLKNTMFGLLVCLTSSMRSNTFASSCPVTPARTSQVKGPMGAPFINGIGTDFGWSTGAGTHYQQMAANGVRYFISIGRTPPIYSQPQDSNRLNHALRSIGVSARQWTKSGFKFMLTITYSNGEFWRPTSEAEAQHLYHHIARTIHHGVNRPNYERGVPLSQIIHGVQIQNEIGHDIHYSNGQPAYWPLRDDNRSDIRYVRDHLGPGIRAFRTFDPNVKVYGASTWCSLNSRSLPNFRRIFDDIRGALKFGAVYRYKNDLYSPTNTPQLAVAGPRSSYVPDGFSRHSYVGSDPNRIPQDFRGTRELLNQFKTDVRALAGERADLRHLRNYRASLISTEWSMQTSSSAGEDLLRRIFTHHGGLPSIIDERRFHKTCSIAHRLCR